jgi:hypothetical protein
VHPIWRNCILKFAVFHLCTVYITAKLNKTANITTLFEKRPQKSALPRQGFTKEREGDCTIGW